MNNINKYPWQRYWCPRNGSINLSDDGFLLKPSDDNSWYRYLDYTTFENLTGFNCLVLLGEPGLGKSFCLKTEYEKEKNLSSDSQFIFRNLNQYSSDTDLYRDLFDHIEYLTAKACENKIVLYLDSLDESLIQIKTVAKIIIRELRKYSPNHISIRITCRSAEWPHYFENDLVELFSERQIGVYELVPLTKDDVKIVLHQNNISEINFFKEIAEKQLSSFAAKPITLFFLTNLFKNHGCLPHSKTELYKQGIKYLSQESNEFRKTLTIGPAISNDFIYSVAERIAALTMFSNYSNIFIGNFNEFQSDSDISISELEGGFEVVAGVQTPVTENIIRQVLNTGLFSLRGNNKVGWAHQTFAEFLAASYLMSHNFVPNQIFSIISQTYEEYRHVVPQFYEVAAWLPSLKTEYFSLIFEISPESLLKSDLSLIDDGLKKLLVNKLLEKYNNKEIYDSDRKRFLYYRNLKHPELAKQIKEYITDKSKYYLSRNIAIDIAEECTLIDVKEQLLKVIFDHSDQYYVRSNALHAYAKIFKSEDLIILKNLLRSEDDQDDDFRGIIFNSLWPEHLTAQELFENLTVPRRLIIGNAYWLFTYNNPIRQLKINDLPIAIEWACKLYPRRPLKDSFDAMIDSVVQLAWEILENSDIVVKLSRLILKKSRNHEPILIKSGVEHLNKQIKENPNKRRILLKGLIQSLPDPKKNYYYIISYLYLVFPEDYPWLLSEYSSYDLQNNVDIKMGFAEILRHYYDFSDPEFNSEIIEKSYKDEILKEVFGSMIDPIELNSEQAAKLKNIYTITHKSVSEEVNQRITIELKAEDFLEYISRVERNDLEGWWQLNYEFAKVPQEDRYTCILNEIEPDLRLLPAWELFDDNQKKRTLDAAYKYICEYTPNPDKWIGTNTELRPDIAGYRAILLLMNEDIERFNSLNKSIWDIWTPVIVGYPHYSSFDADDPNLRLINEAYHYSPLITLNYLKKVIAKECVESKSVSILKILKGCYDDQITNFLVELINDESLSPTCKGQIHFELTKRNFKLGINSIDDLIDIKDVDNPDIRDQLVEYIVNILRVNTNDGWNLFQELIKKYEYLTRNILIKLSYNSSDNEVSIYDKLSEIQLSNLYNLIERNFTITPKDDNDDSMHYGPVDSIHSFKNGLINYLVSKGSCQAVKALENIKMNFAQHDWINRVIYEAKMNMFSKTWTPVKPRHLLQLANNNNKRLVNNGDELIAIILDSLERINVKLQGETPEAKFLWNKYYPKDENDFSDYLKNRLQDDLINSGIIINREVEIRRSSGGKLGERTDIHVNAVIHDQINNYYNVITVIIEVKGCWHHELFTAMKTQLCDRYLKDNQCSYGIYLVGWFVCPQWEDELRKRSSPKMSFEDVKGKLISQAEQLSSDGLSIKSYVINASLR